MVAREGTAAIAAAKVREAVVATIVCSGNDNGGGEGSEGEGGDGEGESGGSGDVRGGCTRGGGGGWQWRCHGCEESSAVVSEERLTRTADVVATGQVTVDGATPNNDSGVEPRVKRGRRNGGGGRQHEWHEDGGDGAAAAERHAQRVAVGGESGSGGVGELRRHTAA